MDLAEIKERSERDWTELVNHYTLNSERAEACANQQMKDVRDLIAKVERLTERCSMLEQESEGRYFALAKACQEKANLTIALTLSREEGRREGMERAAAIAETVYADQKLEIRGTGYDIAAAIRSESKGERG